MRFIFLVEEGSIVFGFRVMRGIGVMKINIFEEFGEIIGVDLRVLWGLEIWRGRGGV